MEPLRAPIKDLSDMPEDKASGKPQRSFGNKVFDLVLWPLVMGAGVFALSYLTAKEGTIGTNPRFQGLRDKTEQFTRFLEKKIEHVNGPDSLARKIWKSDSRKWAESWAMWSLVSIPGTLLTPVMQFFEHHRKPISDGIDKVFHKTPVDPDNVKHEPKQTLGSMLSGRAVVTAGAASTLLLLGPRGMEAAGRGVGGATTALYKLVRPGVDHARLERFRKNSDIAVFDMILTMGATAVMYGYSRHAARKHEEAKLRNEVAELKQDISRVKNEEKHTAEELKVAEQDNKPSFTARTGERSADFRALAQKEPVSNGMALP